MFMHGILDLKASMKAVVGTKDEQIMCSLTVMYMSQNSKITCGAMLSNNRKCAGGEVNMKTMWQGSTDDPPL